MDSGTGRPRSCGVEPLECRYMMDSELGQLIAEGVKTPAADLVRPGRVIALAVQEFHEKESPAPIVEHATDADRPNPP